MGSTSRTRASGVLSAILRRPATRIAVLLMCVLCFLSVAGTPAFLYFRVDQLNSGGAAAACAGVIVLLAIAWVCVCLLKEKHLLKERDWRDRHWDRFSGMMVLFVIGGGLAFGGAWLLIRGIWIGAALAVVGLALGGLGLGLFRTLLVISNESQASPASMDSEAASSKRAKPSRVQSADRRLSRDFGVFVALAVGSGAAVAVVPRVSYLGVMVTWAVVLGTFDVVLVPTVAPRFWRRYGTSRAVVRKWSSVKRFDWRWFDGGFIACVAMALAAIAAVQWRLSDTPWVFHVAAFVSGVVLLVLVYEGLRRSIWAPRLERCYPRVFYCSRCDMEVARGDVRCPGCKSMFAPEWST